MGKEGGAWDDRLLSHVRLSTTNNGVATVSRSCFMIPLANTVQTSLCLARLIHVQLLKGLSFEGFRACFLHPRVCRLGFSVQGHSLDS